jgi:hypothetical protein
MAETIQEIPVPERIREGIRSLGERFGEQMAPLYENVRAGARGLGQALGTAGRYGVNIYTRQPLETPITERTYYDVLNRYYWDKQKRAMIKETLAPIIEPIVGGIMGQGYAPGYETYQAQVPQAYSPQYQQTIAQYQAPVQYQLPAFSPYQAQRQLLPSEAYLQEYLPLVPPGYPSVSVGRPTGFFEGLITLMRDADIEPALEAFPKETQVTQTKTDFLLESGISAGIYNDAIMYLSRDPSAVVALSDDIVMLCKQDEAGNPVPYFIKRSMYPTAEQGGIVYRTAEQDAGGNIAWTGAIKPKIMGRGPFWDVAYESKPVVNKIEKVYASAEVPRELTQRLFQERSYQMMMERGIPRGLFEQMAGQQLLGILFEQPPALAPVRPAVSAEGGSEGE